jgi:hypothetical protein
MSILSQTALEAAIATLVNDNNAGEVSPLDVRTSFGHIIDSLQSYGGVITDGVVNDIQVTDAGAKWTNFVTNSTSANAVLEADADNDRILVKQPALYFVAFQFLGSWPTNEDLQFEIYVNNAANPSTPIVLPSAGRGAGNPNIVSIAEAAFIVNASMIAAGGGQAAVTLNAKSLTGTFEVDQTDVTLGLRYNPLSIGTVG